MSFDVDADPPSDPLYFHLWLSQLSGHLCFLARQLVALPSEPCADSLVAARAFIHAARKWENNRNLPIESDGEVCLAWANVSRHCEPSVEVGRRWLSALREDGDTEDDESEHVHGGLPAWIVPVTAIYEDDCPMVHQWVERTMALTKWWNSSISSHPELPQDSKPTPDIIQSFDRDYWKEVNSDIVGPVHAALSADWKGATFNPVHHVSLSSEGSDEDCTKATSRPCPPTNSVAAHKPPVEGITSASRDERAHVLGGEAECSDDERGGKRQKVVLIERFVNSEGEDEKSDKDDTVVVKTVPQRRTHSHSMKSPSSGRGISTASPRRSTRRSNGGISVSTTPSRTTRSSAASKPVFVSVPSRNRRSSTTKRTSSAKPSIGSKRKHVSVEIESEDEDDEMCVEDDDEKGVEDVDRHNNDVQEIGEEGPVVEAVADEDTERPTVRHRYADNALPFMKKKYNGKDTAWRAAVEMDGVEVVKSDRRCEWCAGVAPEGPKYKLSCRRITNYGNYEVPEDDDGCIQCFLSGRVCVWAWTRNSDGSMPEQEPTSGADDRGEGSPDSPTSPPCVKPEYKEEDGGARDSKFGRGVATVDVFGVSVPIADCQTPPGAGPSALDSDRARLRERALDLLQDSTLAKVAIAEAAARKDRVIADALVLVEDYVSFMARGDKVTTDTD